MVIHKPTTFLFFRDFFAFGFDTTTKFGNILHWVNFAFNCAMVIIEVTFNIMSIWCVRKITSQTQSETVIQTQKREIKLLIQCVIISCVLLAATIIFGLSNALAWDTKEEFLGIQAGWTFNHCVNPMVYLSVNTTLRKSFIRFVSCGMWRKSTSTSTVTPGL